MFDSYRQFFPPVSTAPVPPFRNKNGHHIGGPELDALNSEVDDLARVLFGATRFVTISESAKSMPQAYNAALAIVLNRHEFTAEFTPDELARLKEREAQKIRNEKFAADDRKRAEAFREKERVDRLTREQAADFKPRSQATPKGSPAYAIERARFISDLNETRAKHELSPLSV